MKDTSCGYPENRYNNIVQIWTARERINGDIFMTEKGGNKMDRKRRIAPLLTAALLLALLTACGGNTGGAQGTEEPEIPAAEDTVPQATQTADSPEESAGATHTNAFDFEKKTVLLNNGMEMPIIGIGTFTLSKEL